MSINNSLILPLANRRGWKPAQRSTEDLQPIILSQDTDQISEDDQSTTCISKASPCIVCQKNEGRYVCPRCQSPYCCVECYRKHTVPSSSPENTSGASACTEAFYQNRVSSILQLERLEQKDNTHKILSKQYEAMRDEELDLSGDLFELLSVLEQEEKEDLTQEQLLSIMSPSLRAAFQRDLQNGSMNELILHRWYPWWRRELGTSSEIEMGTNIDNSNKESNDTSLSIKTLDERLSKVPDFRSLFPKGNPPQLLYNLFDILYSVCWTLRLYHGVTNATQVSWDASTTLLTSSSVLNEDARYATLEEALINCTSSSTKQYPAGCNTHWIDLAEDCALLVTSHRLVGRALLEGIDIIKHTIKTSKKQDQSQTSEDAATELQKSVGILRRKRKKLEFYLSWSLQAQVFGDELKDEVNTWIEGWKNLPGQGDNDDDDCRLFGSSEGISINKMKLPDEATKPKPTRQDDSNSPLFVEVETTRKTKA